MKPGTIIVNETAANAVTEFLADDDMTYCLVFEAIAGGDAVRIAEARNRFREVTALLAAQMGQPDFAPTRKQGMPGAPDEIDPRWSEASVWRNEAGAMIVATLGGIDGGALEVSLCRRIT